MTAGRRALPTLLFALCACLSPAAENSYARIGDDGITVISGNEWYLEEHDALGRPARAAEWKDGRISALTDWIYEGDAPICSSKVVTGDEGSVVTDYDSRGDEIRVERKNAAGVTLSVTERRWDGDRRETSRSVREGDVLTVEEWTYGEDGELESRRLERNGETVLTARYRSESEWTETVYLGGRAVFTQRFENGRRVAPR